MSCLPISWFFCWRTFASELAAGLGLGIQRFPGAALIAPDVFFGFPRDLDAIASDERLELLNDQDLILFAMHGLFFQC